MGRPDFKSGERRSTSLVGSTPTLFRQLELSEAPLDIIDLREAAHLSATLERWFIAEWEPWYGPSGVGDAAADLAACCNNDALPVCLVAVDAQGKAVGTATLKPDSVGSELGVGPWLAAVLVPVEYQGGGIGTALVAAIETIAGQLGFESIFSSTDSAAGILTRSGWRAYGATTSLRGPLSVFRRDLPPRLHYPDV